MTDKRFYRQIHAVFRLSAVVYQIVLRRTVKHLFIELFRKPRLQIRRHLAGNLGHKRFVLQKSKPLLVDLLQRDIMTEQSNI